MEEHVVRAVARYIRMSPRKVRTVANELRGKRVDEANAILGFAQRAAVEPLYKVINSAVAAAKQAGNFDVDSLYVKEIFVDKGPVVKRGHHRSRGMVYRINKFMSHVTVVVGEKE
ncbi:MAG TPA: 50S ribosomal protein L22 [Myxococcota bacterium]|nr:50S ribosomal protein L22 [Myxococcota bacterium]HNZ02614.1 50S ribosomal protein L22 [Myxococcota bacterium]HOD08179.1 50S ribosomal protein L22 [Myxococcota bacterium]HPB50318.1 50S ribosomal protein L22 [Myxococcota bacterium]HQP95870.1 50S ribosomal protein L22 [Myxococcota bacterium]